MASLLDPWIDAEQRYAEDEDFRRMADEIREYIFKHGATATDLRQATMVILRQCGQRETKEPQIVGP